MARGAYEPERVQVCLQALLLEEHGDRVEEGAIWYAGGRERVRVALDDELRKATHDAVSRLRLTVAHGRILPPLRDSPKCPRCALVSVCLPNEMNALGGSDLAPRPIAIPSDEALPLVVQSRRARITKSGDTLRIAAEEKGDTTVRLNEVSDVALFGNVAITTPALAARMEREIPVTFHSHGGWFRGMTHGIGHRNVEVRTAQYWESFDEMTCLRFARGLIAAKIVHQRISCDATGEVPRRSALIPRVVRVDWGIDVLGWWVMGLGGFTLWVRVWGAWCLGLIWTLSWITRLGLGR